MKLLVRRHGVELPEPMAGYIDRRVRLTLGRFAALISRVSVYVEDVNGPRGGGADKLCRIEARIQGMRAVVVEDRSKTLRESFDQAIGRIGRTIRRVALGRRAYRRQYAAPSLES